MHTWRTVLIYSQGQDAVIMRTIEMDIFLWNKKTASVWLCEMKTCDQDKLWQIEVWKVDKLDYTRERKCFHVNTQE